VPEPQHKIKLKVPAASEQPAGSKRITIHVGGRGGSADSPAPPTGNSIESRSTELGAATNGNSLNGAASVSANQLDKTRSLSASVPSPSPSTIATVKREDTARASPAVSQPTNPLLNGSSSSGLAKVHMPGQVTPARPETNGVPTHDQKYRAAGKGIVQTCESLGLLSLTRPLFRCQ
jgi:hypothetical protein